MTTMRKRLCAALAAAAFCSLSQAAGAAEARTCASSPMSSAGMARDAQAFLATLSPTQRSAAVKPLARADAIRWSNLPVAMAPRIGVRLGDLGAGQVVAGDRLLKAALSTCGFQLWQDIRAADGVLKPKDSRGIGWDSANYFIAFIGEPRAGRPWILKADGHHIAYNIAFNAAQVSATPLFDGIDPVRFETARGEVTPLAFQADAMRDLAAAIAQTPGSRLSGTFRDITRGAKPEGDTDFPISYPTAAADRGVAFAALDARQKAAVMVALEAWTRLPNAAISRPLVKAYTSPAALAETFVGLSGEPDLTKPGMYLRIDGPRLWIEFIVQPAVADPSATHYHSIWRDKLADYGAAFGP